MSLFSRLLGRKALSEMRHPTGRGLFHWRLPRTKYDYAKDVGDGTGSSSIMAPIQWLQRAITESPLEVMRKTKEEREVVPNHPMTAIVARPNDFYSGRDLLSATIFSWCVSGNAYWLKLRNAGGKVIQLWWVPSNLIEPKWPDGGATFISHYEYKPGGMTQRIGQEDVVHFRHGIDPVNPRLGISPLRAVMREVWTDDEASNFVGAVLRNGGIPGVILSPKDGMAMSTDLDAMKKYIAESFTGDRRGEPLAVGAPTDIHEFGWSPEKLNLSVVRDVAEERVCACLGIPAAVVGFGSGLQQTKVGATMRELVRMAWTDGVIPLQRAMGSDITHSLLPDFERQADRWAEFDVRGIQALQEDLTALYTRAEIGLRGGFLMVSEAKRMVGLKPGPADDVYLRSIILAEVPAGRSMSEAERAPSRAGEKAASLPPVLQGPQTGEPVWAEGGDLMGGGMKAGDSDPAPQAIIHSAPHRRPARANIAALRALDALHGKLAGAFAARLKEWLGEVGEEIARAAGEVLGAKGLDDEIDVEAILNGTHFQELLASGKRRYDAHFTATSRETFGAMNSSFGLQTDLPDPAAVRILREGGRRFDMLGLRKATREKLFTILAESREEGLGAEEIRKRIRETVGAGPWSDPDVRARVVARTETKYAQNLSVAEYAKASGAPRVMVFDARLGPTDEECEALNGAIVSAEDAETLAASEHPNGTRSFTPWFEADS